MNLYIIHTIYVALRRVPFTILKTFLLDKVSELFFTLKQEDT